MKLNDLVDHFFREANSRQQLLGLLQSLAARQGDGYLHGYWHCQRPFAYSVKYGGSGDGKVRYEISLSFEGGNPTVVVSPEEARQIMEAALCLPLMPIEDTEPTLYSFVLEV